MPRDDSDGHDDRAPEAGWRDGPADGADGADANVVRPATSATEGPFARRLHARVEALDSRLGLAVAPRPDRHPSTHPGAHDGDPARVARAVVVYFRDLIDASAAHLALATLRTPWFERMGVPGLIAMAQLVADLRDRGVPCVLDAKRGDDPAGAEAYADAYLGGGVFAADALTTNLWEGLDALEPFLLAAERNDKGVFALVHGAGAGSGDLQDLETGAGTVAQRLADLLTERARDLGVDAHGYGPLGAVVGGARPGQLADLRRRLPHAPLLVPEDAPATNAVATAAAFDRDGLGAVVVAGDALAYRDGDDPPLEAEAAAREAKEALNAAIAAR